MDHDQRCAALYDAGNNTPGPVPDGLVVVGADGCVLCKNTMRNNGYATRLADGSAVTWLSISEDAGLNKFYAIPGIAYDYAREYPTAAGKQVGGTPAYLWVQDGKVSIGPLAGGEQPAGGLDYIATTAAGKLGI